MSPERSRQSISRAEQLRQKRQQPSRQPVIPAKQPAPRPVTRSVPLTRTTSVTSRSSYPYGTPLRQSANTNPRRKVYYAVNSNGVETRFPSLPIFNFSWQWVSGSLAILCLILALLMTNLSSFEVSSVDIQGIKRLTAADVETVVRTSTKSIFTIDRQKTIDAVAIAFPELTNIHMSVSFPSTLKFSVTERQPILAWTNGDQTIWVDSQGVVFPPRGDAGTLLTVQATGNAPLTKLVETPKSALDYAVMVIDRKTTPITPADAINNIDPAVMKAAIELSAQMPSGATLVYDSVSGMGWQDPRGWKVYFGTTLDNIQFKQVEYNAIVDRLSQLGITPTTISVDSIDSPYFRTN